MHIHFTTVFLLAGCLLNILNAQEDVFQEVAGALGIEHVYPENPLTFRGGGISFADINGDNLPDLTFATEAGEPLGIYANIDGLYFEPYSNFAVLAADYDSKTILWVDVDNDGDRDLFLADYNGTCRLYRNIGNDHFNDITDSCGIATDSLSLTASCWADFDNDGWVDVYITNHHDIHSNRLYRNLGNGLFEDITAASGAADAGKSPLAVHALDYDGDGWQDIYVGSHRQRRNTMLHNNGDGTFSDVSIATLTDLPMESMGITVGDIDHDLDLDICISNGPDGNALLRNNNGQTFTNVGDSLGVAVNKLCWGVNFFDFDNDRDLDLYVCASEGPPDRRNILFENVDGSFIERSDSAMGLDMSISFGNAVADADNDGYPDLAVLNEGGPSALWQNRLAGNQWIKLRLEGTVSNRDGIGSLLTVYAGGVARCYPVHCGTSYLSQNSFIQTIGLGSATMVDSLVIDWPSGTRDVHYQLPAGDLVHLLEGEVYVSLNAPVAAPQSAQLLGNYPNPFNPQTTIRYHLNAAAKVKLAIYDIAGRLVTTLVDRWQRQGEHSVTWNGVDSYGSAVSSGVYIYRLISLQEDNLRSASASQKMVLLK